MTSPILARLDARDRALFLRWVMRDSHAPTRRLAWTTITHLGGPWASVLLALLPLVSDGPVAGVGVHALATLVLSHLLVQVVKRTVGRPRPSLGTGCSNWAVEPDRFSFPSGHATAAMSVALAYGVALPALAAPMLLLGVLIGLSRVCLGVHYPGDVLIGQALAIGTGVALHLLL